MKKFFKDFKAFISRGNILDMAVGVIIGSAFSAIVTAFTNKIIMPIVNYILSLIGGGTGLDSAYTFLKKAMTENAAGETVVDLANSIYIDWGAFITAILNFLIIAMTLFIILKVAMNASGLFKKTMAAKPTRAERKELAAQGVNMKDHKAVLHATQALRESKVPAPVPPKPTTEELLAQILEEMKGSKKQEIKQAKPVEAKAERKPGAKKEAK